MDDRQLLEAAARAAGIEGRYFENDNPIHCGIYRAEHEYYWNPLISDSEAFRLAVKLNLTVRHYMGNTCAQTVTPGSLSVYVEETDVDEPLTAARRAIVKAAAAMDAASRAKGV
ncbi:hypothetical protein [Xenophilus sp.]|uniref:hypothetical protein n=1 Tax=Xenophilus sp. TaxID=1873499 RepID=UPI0037DD7A99